MAAIANADEVISLICICLCLFFVFVFVSVFVLQKREAAWQQLRMQMRRLLCCFTLPDSIVGTWLLGLCHYFGQDYAIAWQGWEGLWDYPDRDYAIIGPPGVVAEG